MKEMKKKRRPITYRIIAFVLAFAMIFTSVNFTDLGSIDAKAAEADGWYWTDDTLYIKDGEITKAQLYAALNEKYDDGGYGSFKYDSADHTNWTSNGTEVKSSSSGDITVPEGTGYAKSRGRLGYSTGGSKWSFTVKYYYEILTAVADGSPEGAGISVATKNVVKGNTVEVTVNTVEGYTASVADSKGNAVTNLDAYAPTESTTLTVTYTSNAVTKYNVTVEEENGDFGTATLKSEDELVEGAEVLVEVITNADTSNAHYYVESVKVGDTTLSTNANGYYVYTMGTSDVTVTVTFASKTLNGATTADIEYNPKKTTTDQLEDLKKELFAEIKPVLTESIEEFATLDWDDVAYEYLAENENPSLATEDSKWSELNVVPDNATDALGIGSYRFYAFAEDGIGSKEQIRITWPGGEINGKTYPSLCIEAEITLIDARPMHEVVCNIAQTEGEAISLNTVDELKEALLETGALTVIGDGQMSDFTFVDFPTTPGKAEVTVKVSFGESDTYQATEDVTFTVWVDLGEPPATIVINKIGDGTVTLNDSEDPKTLSASTEYDLVADPTNEGGFVKTITVTVDGESITYDNYETLSFYSDTVFTDPNFAIENNKTYVITVEFGERELTLADNSMDYNFHTSYIAYNLSGNKLAELQSNVFNALHAGNGENTEKPTVNQVDIQFYVNPKVIYSSDTGWHALNFNGSNAYYFGERGSGKSEEIQITWAGDARYPTLTGTATLTLNEIRTAAVFPTMDFGIIEFDTLEQLDADVTSKVKAEDARITSVTRTTTPALDQDGIEQTASYTLTIPESTTTLGGTTTITVSVIGIVHPATINITEVNDWGNVEVTDSLGATVANGSSYAKDTLSIVVTPLEDSAYYVESVGVDKNGDGEADDTVSLKYNSLTATGSYAIVNADYEAPLTYNIIVTYGERVIPEKEEHGEVFYNATWNYEEHEAVFLTNVYDAIVDSTPEDTVTKVELVDTAEPVVGQENAVKITWEATEKYPEVSIETTVMVTENRSQAVIEVETIADQVVDGEFETIKAQILSAVETKTRVSEGAEDPVFTLLDTTIPKQGETLGIRVKISVDENDTWLAAEDVIVTVNVTGKTHLSTVTIADYDTNMGTVKVTTAGGKVIEGSDTCLETDLEIVVDPNSNYYVESVKVTPTNTKDDTEDIVEGSYASTVFTGQYSVEDGSGLELSDADNSYVITVVFAERVLALTEKSTISINGYKANIIDTSYQRASYVSELTADKFVDYTNCLGGTASASNCVIEMEYSYGVGKTFATAENIPVTALDTSGSKTIRITWNGDDKYPTVSTTKSVTIIEARDSAELSIAETIVGIEFESEADIKNHIIENIVNPNGINLSNVTVTLSEGTLPTTAQVPTEVTYTVSFAGDATYKPWTGTVTLTVIRSTYLCPVTLVEDRTNADIGSFEPTVTISGTKITAGTALEVDGQTTHTVIVKPYSSDWSKGSNYAIESVVVKDASGNVISTEPTFKDRVATLEFTTDGKNQADTYTIEVKYMTGTITADSTPEAIEYCYEQSNVSKADLQKMVFDAIYESDTLVLLDSKGNDVPLDITSMSEVTVEYLLSTEDLQEAIKDLDSSLIDTVMNWVNSQGMSWTEVGENPSFSLSILNGLTHNFGESGKEQVRIKYTDAQYGDVVSNAVELLVFDACYNTDITVEEIPDGHKGKWEISVSNIAETKEDKSGNEKYKEGTTYTIAVTPGNGTGNSAMTEAEYVESIIVKDAEGNDVETSELIFDKATEILGASWEEPTASITFTTGTEAAGTRSDYTVYITYQTAAYALDSEAGDPAVFDMYLGAKNLAGVVLYTDVIPSAEEIFTTVIDEANTLPQIMADYEASKADIVMQYSVDGSTWNDISTISTVADGSEVTLKITYDIEDSYQYRPIYVEKQIVVRDPRTATTISAGSITEELEYVEYDTVAATIKDLLAPVVLAGTTEVTDKDDVEIELTQPYEKEEGSGKFFVDATLIYAGTAYEDGVGYKPSELEVKEIPVKDLPADCTVDVVSSLGTVEIIGQTADAETGIYTFMGNTSYSIKVTPDAGYAVDSVVLKKVTEGTELTEEAIALEYNDKIATGKITVKEKEDYILVVSYAEQKFTFKEEAERVYAFRFGIDNPSDPDQIVALYNSVVADPVHDTVSTLPYSMDVRYLAREAGEQTIYIPELKIPGLNITVYEGGDYTFDMEELWLTPGTTIENVDLYEEIAKIEDMFRSIDYKNISEITKVTEYVQDFLDRLPTMQIGAHYFGADGDGAIEKICLSYDNEKYVINAPISTADADSITTVMIQDSRIDTQIAGADAAVSYGATVDEIYAALGIDVVKTEDGTTTGQKATIVTRTDKLDADDTPYRIEVYYPGNEEYQPATATFNLTVNKATCTIDYDTQFVKYGTPYEFELVKNPEDVQTIDIMIGLDMDQMAYDKLVPAGYISVKLPGILGSIFQAETNLGEFLGTLGDLASSGGSLLEGLGISSDTLTTVINAIESVIGDSEELLDITVKVNSDDFKPTDVGVYIAGAVTADANYETAYTVDFLVIYPDGVEADLDWRFEDSNGIIMKNLIEDGLYDLGANGFVDGELSTAATDAVKHIFLQLDVDGNFELIFAGSNEAIDDSIDQLTKTGAYVQLAMALDWGNQFYYSVPIVRAYAVIPEILKVNFVDEEGNATREFTEVFNGTNHELDVVVSDNYGDVLAQSELDQYLEVTYYGYTLNHPEQIYQSTVAPKDAGIYTAVATFIDKEGGRYGADVALLTIKNAEATLDVENQVVTFGGGHDLGITCTPEDCKYISIVAGIDAGGDISLEDLNPLSGTINIDFPDRLDKILQNYMPEAYRDGMAANDMIDALAEMAGMLEEYGISEEVVNTIQSVIDMIPETELGEHKVTFKNNVVPQNVGLYIVAGVTCDPNYTFGADVGYLVVAPDSHNAELAFNYTDANHIFTLNYIKSGDIDLGSHVVVGGDMTAEMALEAEEQLVNIYLGIGTDGQISISNEPIKAHGAYTQIAYLEVNNLNQFYYAEPIIRGYLVVPETVKVQFVDETGAVNPDRMFTHTGDPIEMPVKVTHNNGTDLSDNDALTVTYLGYDAKGIQIYNSTTPPTNIGAYTAIAVYADKEADLYGMAIGAMVIGQADVTIEVKDQHVLMGDDYDLGITVTPEACETIKVVAGITTDASSLESAVNSIAAVVNVDFPDSMDVYLQKYLPEAYGEGMTINEMIEVLNKLPDKLAEKGLSEDVVEALREVIGQIPVTELGEQIVTFKNDVVPQELGVYMVGAVVCDLNYKAAYDTGYLIIGDIVDVTLVDEAGVEMSAAEYTYDGTPKGVLATVVDSDGNAVSEEDIAKYLTITYTGYSLNNPTEIYSSTDAPVHAGIYTVTAVFADHDKGRFGAAVGAIVINMAESTITVEDQVVSGLDTYDLGITVTPEDCKYISIVAGVNVGGDQITDALGTVAGAVNVDFPSRVDALLKQYIPEAYEGGMTVNELLSKLSQLAGKLGEYGMPEDIVTALQDAFGQIPVEEIGGQVVTFTDDYLPTQLGVYAVAAVTCDPDYIPAADAGYLLVGELVDVTFVDGDNQTFTYDGTPKSMTVEVTREDGTVLDAADNLTVTYLGFDANGVEIYNSTTPPTNAGVYSAIASYYAPNKGLVGMAVGVMTIKPAETTIDVANQTGGVGEITNLGITVTPEDCKYISIVAGLNAGETELDDLLGTAKGTVNIDFPTRIDAVLKAYAPEVLDGATVDELITALQDIVTYLEKVGVDAATIAEIQDVIGQIPTEGIGDQLVTFTDGFVPNEMGVYAVAAVTCDANYKVAADLGYILIGEVVTVEVPNQTFTYNGAPQGVDVTVTTEDGTVIDGTENATIIYLGYDAKGIEIYNSTTPPTNVGGYSVIALYYDSAAGYVGLGTGLMAITPAAVSINVESQAVKANTDYSLNITTDPADVAYTTVVAGINVKGNSITDIANESTGVVNIDFPAEIDSILQKYVPEIYEEGTTVNSLIATLSDAVAELAEYGVSYSFVKEVQDALAQIPASDLGDQLITFKDGFAPQQMGVYAVAAVTSDVNYQVAGDVGFLLVGDTVEVQLLDAAGNVTDYTSFTYNGQPQGLTTKVVASDGTVLENADALSVNYIGYDAKGIEFYNSTTAPTNAGLYVQTAIYFDAANGLVGAAVGTFTIGQGAATIDVVNQNVTMGSDYDLGITVTPDNCDYISIVAGVKVEGDSLSDLVGSAAGLVNVDFPESIDAIFEELMPEEYANGMTINEMIEKLGQIPEELKELGVPATITDEIQNVVDQIPVTDLGNQLVTFHDGLVPQEMGIYAVGAVTCDVNYEVAADLGYLVVGQSVDVKFIDDNGNVTNSVVYTYDGQPHGLDVVVTAQDGTDLSDSSNLTFRYIGADAGGLGVYNSTEAPKNAGVYTVTAMYYDNTTGQMGIGIGIVAIEPRAIDIQINPAEKLVGDVDPAFTYTLVDPTQLVAGDTLTMTFEREEGEAAGTYVITPALTDIARNLNYSINATDGVLTIKERELVVTLDDITVTYGEEPEFTYTIEGPYLVPDVLKEIVAVYDIEVVEDVTGIGTYTTTAKATFVDGINPVVNLNYAGIYNVTVVGGTYTIEAKSIADATVAGHNDVIYNGTAQTFDNLMVIDGNIVLTEGVDYTVEYVSNKNVGEAVIIIKGMGNYTGEKTATFKITEADNEWSKQLSIQGWTYGEYDPNVNAPSAATVAGDAVTYEYFADAACTVTLEEAIGQKVPSAATPVGTYYVRALTVDADTDNYKQLVSQAVAFTVVPKSIEGADVTVTADLTFNGQDQTPDSVVVKLGGKTLVEGTDYTVKYSDNVEAGEAMVTIIGQGNYIDEVTAAYTIAKKSLEGAVIEGLTNYIYDGTAKTPVPTVQLDGLTIADYNYHVTYEANINVGTATVTITADADSNYTGSVTATFAITPATNVWTDALTIAGWEYGKYDVVANSPDADALYGDVIYTFYKDAALTNVFTPGADTPVGIYYVKAEVPAEAVHGNYGYISAVKEFRVTKAMIPTGSLEYTSIAYDGTAKEPAVTIDGLTEGVDYVVSYADNTDAGNAVVTVTATNNSNYYGSQTLTFKIVPTSLENADVMVDALPSMTYTGDPLTQADQAFDVTVNGKELVFGEDYTVSYMNNVNVGTATVFIKVTGNYYGVLETTFDITPAALPEAALEYDTVAYDGTAKRPEVTIEGLREGVDFAVDYGTEDNTAVGVYTVKIFGINNYEGERFKTFTVTARSLEDANVYVSDLIYTGSNVTHTFSDAAQFRVVVDGVVLDPRTDYIVSYSNNKEAGTNTARVIIRGNDNYTGVIEVPFSICMADNEWVEEITIADEWGYGTAAKKPSAKAKFGKVQYEYFADPDCIYSVDAPNATTPAGTYFVRAVVEGTKAYTGLVGDPVAFTITAKSLEGATVRIYEDKVYDGSEQFLDPENIVVRLNGKTLTHGEDYVIDRFEDNVDATTEAKVYLMGIGSYEGELVGTFEIEKAPNAWIDTVQMNDWMYGDEPLEPWANAEYGSEDITYKYFTDKLCTNEIAQPTEVGTYYVKAYVAETDNYKGLTTRNSEAAKFSIVPTDFRGSMLEYYEVVYDGTAKTPSVTVEGANGTTLVEGTDYTVSYENNVETGIATVVITGIGNYQGEWIEQFIIMPIEILAEDISGVEDKVYTGEPIEQDLTIVVNGVTLTPEEDYVIEYVGDNVEVGTVYMYVYGNGNYDCNVLKAFQILPAKLTDAALEYTTVEEDGDAKTPEVVVTGVKDVQLEEDTDYYVTYADNVKAGTATVTINGLGNYAGSTLVKTFQITAKEVIPPVEPEYALTDAVLEYASIVYDGTAKMPSVIVKDGTTVLELEEDYIVSYKNNVNAGTATVTIKGIGNYKGEMLEKTFQIDKADNAWTKDLAITGWTYGEYNAVLNAPSAEAKVGEAAYEYMKVIVKGDGTIETVALDQVPTEVGLYLVKATVPASANYNALVSGLVDFNISPKALNDDNVKVTGIVDKTYTGEAQTQDGLKVTIGGKELVIGKDIEVSYEDNVNAGEATVTIKPAVGSSYTESITATFDIEAAALPEATLEYTTVEADGTAKKPAVSIEGLKENVDFTVTYTENVEAGTAIVTVAGTGNYEGTQVLTFKITEAEEPPVTMYTVTFDTLGGSEVAPIVTEAGKEVVLPAAPTLDGATFLGWALTAEAKEAQYQPGDKFIVTADITVYAVWDKDDVTQIFGKGRYQTAMGIAENLKEEMGVDKFSTIIVATGENFADALSGSYLSYVKNAPILLINGGSAAEVTAYINANLVSGGKVYVLGGDAAVKESWISGIKSSNIERLKGKTRYETNIEILKEAGVKSGELLVATGEVFADSLSAASAKKPIFLVKGDTLSTAQREFLGGLRGDSYCIIGGAAAVSNAMEDQIAKYGNIDRVKGRTRYQTSIAVAESFVSNPEAVVIAYGQNFPDGLCGGLLAIVSGSPVILSSDANVEGTAEYIEKYGITEGYVLGGDACFKDGSIAEMFDIATDDIVKFRYPDAVK